MPVTKRRAPKKTLTFDCIKVKQSNQVFYTFKAPIDQLARILDVKVREEEEPADGGEKSGYQRHFSASRVKQIAKYYRDGNCIPLPVLVSFDNAEVNSSGNKITVPLRRGAGWIIDGQHRFLGAKESGLNIELSVTAFSRLKIDDQINQFVTINKTARGVPSSLYLDLLPRLRINKTPKVLADERATDLANILKQDEESPFYGKIAVVQRPQLGELSLVNFCRKISPLVISGSGVLHVYDASEQAVVLSNYYMGLERIFPREYRKEKSKFFQTIGFGALMEFFPTLFTTSMATHKGSFTVDNVASLFKLIEDFDFAAWDSYGSGSKAETEAAKDMKAQFDDALAVSEKTKKIRLK